MLPDMSGMGVLGTGGNLMGDAQGTWMMPVLHKGDVRWSPIEGVIEG